jgi:hypothetical protein
MEMAEQRRRYIVGAVDFKQYKVRLSHTERTRKIVTWDDLSNISASAEIGSESTAGGLIVNSQQCPKLLLFGHVASILALSKMLLANYSVAGLCTPSPRPDPNTVVDEWPLVYEPNELFITWLFIISCLPTIQD